MAPVKVPQHTIKMMVAALTASAACVGFVADKEGWVKVGYRDPVNIPTACGGHTKTAAIGKRYTDAECADLLLKDLTEHAVAIAPCLPADLPVETRAAFVSAAFNIGVTNFCRSSMSKKALAGDLKGACAALDLWNKAGGEVLPGLVDRRRDERAMCERGLLALRP